MDSQKIGEPISKTDSHVYTENNLNERAESSRLEKALETASRLADAKGDFGAAAKALDLALTSETPVDSVLKVRALILRADIALRIDDLTLAKNTMIHVGELIRELDQKTKTI